MANTPRISQFFLPLDWKYEVANKELNTENYIRYFLDRTLKIFKYSGLPETVPERALEYLNQTNGFSFWTIVNGDLYAFHGGLGGERNAYYEPTICTVANPALNFNANLKIDVDGVLMRNDTGFVGLVPMIAKYAYLMAENEITMRMATINARQSVIFTTADDAQKESVDLYLKRLERGELAFVTDKNFMQDVKLQPGRVSGSLGIIELIELQQYLKASLYNELGLQSNYNMKREAIGKNEGALNEDALYPLIDNMLECRRDAIDKINRMFGTNIRVDLNSSWQDNAEQKDLEIEQLEEVDENVSDDSL